MSHFNVPPARFLYRTNFRLLLRAGAATGGAAIGAPTTGGLDREPQSAPAPDACLGVGDMLTGGHFGSAVQRLIGVVEPASQMRCC